MGGGGAPGAAHGGPQVHLAPLPRPAVVPPPIVLPMAAAAVAAAAAAAAAVAAAAGQGRRSAIPHRPVSPS